MSVWSSQFALPLLTKELLEQSAKWRLFATRIVYALMLFVAAAIFVGPLMLGSGSTPIGFLGVGKQIFRILINLQFAGVYLFLPAMTCGAITVEKERNTLALLFLTRLGPWTIVFEKLGSRLVTMFGLLLTSLPLMAFTYSLGGIQTFDLICGVWFLILSIIQVGSFAILASAFFRSTSAAFLATYAMILVSGLGPAVLDEVCFEGRLVELLAYLGRTQLLWLFQPEGHQFGYLVRWQSLPPALMEAFTLHRVGQLRFAYPLLILFSLPSLMLSGVSMLAARRYLVHRASLTTANPLLNFFKLLDRLFTWANTRFTRGIVLVKESQTLPDMQPIAWRETTKRSLGQFRYLVRVFIALEFPVLTMMVPFAAHGPQGNVSTEPLSVMLSLVWVVVLLLISVNASNLITAERGRQTLDVILTSPISSRQIILEKMNGLNRLTFVCAIPLLTCVVFLTWWRSQLQNDSDQAIAYIVAETGGLRSQSFLWPEYLIGYVLAIGIYLPLFAWVSLWMGITAKSPARAILSALSTLIAWCVIPVVVTFGMFPHEGAGSPLQLLFLSSPIILIVFSETVGLWWLHPVPYLAVGLNSAIYLACWWFIRRRVLQNADQYLGRLQTSPASAVPVDHLQAIAVPVTS